MTIMRVAVRILFILSIFVQPMAASAAPYAAMVVDARTGKVLHSRNADTRLHPASLTKMMTLYVVFDAVDRGEISLDTMVKISRKAAAEPPSKLGLKAGQQVKLRYLIRAAAVKSANDAATALGEAISGSEAAFARRMTRTAQALGMSKTTFRNAHGLTESGHLSTARDMTRMGRHLFYDFPQYYNIFSRKSTSTGQQMVNNTNRRLLGNYRGADGIKTGYTRAAGYNLVASAERGDERIIATVFGGRSTSWRNARVAELLDMGFSRAPSRVAVVKPKRGALGQPGKSTATTGLIARSPRPAARPAAVPGEGTMVAVAEGITDVLAEVVVADGTTAQPLVEPVPRPVQAASLAGAALRPAPRPKRAEPTEAPAQVTAKKPVVVTRLSTSGGRHWAINIGRYTTRNEAERVLLQTALVEMSTLDVALRKVTRSSKGWEANFVGLTEERAAMACRRLEARNLNCNPVGPG